MANFTWSIGRMTREYGPDAEGHTDIVTSVEWLLTATTDDGEHEARWSGISRLVIDEDADWVPYSEITEELAVEWAQEVEGSDKIDEMEASLEADLEKLVTPTEVTERSGDFPWDPAPPEEDEEDDDEDDS